jgi:hypothetical protein
MDMGRTGATVRLIKDIFRSSVIIPVLQGHSICASVLTTLISLAIAHEDALLILSESPFFIPSLVKLLANLSTALWEEDPELTISEVLSEFVSSSLSPQIVLTMNAG